jgi:type I restriction enzyme S subunit
MRNRRDLKSIKLGSIVKIFKGKKISNVLTINDINAKRYLQIDDLRDNAIPKYCLDSKGVEVEEKDIVIAWDGANAGTVSFGLKGYAGSTLAVLRLTNDQFYTPFIGRFLQSKFNYIRENCTGATIPHVSKNILESIEIPYRPLVEQKRIAAILDMADAVRRKRQETIRLLDEFLRSVFLEMFGDPVRNEKGWEELKLSKVGEINRGVSKHRPRNAPELLGGNYPLIQTGDVANSGLYIREFNQTYSEAGLKQSKMWKKGTLCITIAANIAKASILAFDACFPDSVVGFNANEKTNNIFIYYWFKFFQKIIEANAPESAQKNINLSILNNLSVIVPPIKLQNEFAQIVEKTEQKKLLLEKSLTEMENSFNSMMQKAFRGEL